MCSSRPISNLLICTSLGVDNVIEFNIVTSTGEYLTANSYTHTDLFWALRGGGGGTYGIVTSVTYRTHPSVPLTAFYFAANSTNNQTFNSLFAEFVRLHPKLSTAGFGGYSLVSSNGIIVFYIALNVTQAQANETVDPFLTYAQNLTSQGLDILTASTVPYLSFYSWYTEWYTPTFSVAPPVGSVQEQASRLISRDTIEHNPEGIANALLALDGVIWQYASKTL